MSEIIQQQDYVTLLEKARNDGRIIGFILTGSRGKNMVTEHSDHDIVIVATDEEFADADEEYRKYGKTEEIDIGVKSLSDFKNHAAVGSPEEWDRYNYAHLEVQIDKTGEIQKIVNEKGVLPADSIKRVCEVSLDCYLNYLYRSLKNSRDGNAFASHLDACESIPPLLTFLFALDGRVRPYNKYLEWEFINYPLTILPLDPQAFIDKIGVIIQIGDIITQKEILNLIRDVATRRRYQHIFDGWKGYYFG